MWVGRNRRAWIAAAVATAPLAGCWGPLDSPIPREPAVTRDAGVDLLRRDLATDRPSDGADGNPDRQDTAPPIPDSGPSDASDGRPLPDAGSWPVVPGCVSGSAPDPGIGAGGSTVLTVGCGPLSRVLVRLVDRAGQGMVFDAALDPPVAGFELSYGGYLCAGQVDAPVTINATGMAGLRGGSQFYTALKVSLRGPGAPTLRVSPVVISVVSTNFDLSTDTIDFGIVPSGLFQMVNVTVLNHIPSAAIASLSATPSAADPFYVSSTSSGVSMPIEPGAFDSVLAVYLNALTPGLYQTNFSVSPFVPGAAVDLTCGTSRSLTVRAQVVARSGPGP